MITPNRAKLRPSEKEAFNAGPDAKTWEIVPAVGNIDSTTGAYTAPAEIREEQDITVVAKNAQGNEIGRATVTLLLPPLKVVPTTVDLAMKQQQLFGVAPEESVTWEEPVAGKISNAGVYTAPGWTWMPRVVVLTARSTRDPGRFSSATVNLLDTPIKRWIVGSYLALLVTLLAVLAACLWNYLCPTAEVPSVLVSPPIATLRPQDKQALSASLPGSPEDEEASFLWSKSKAANKVPFDTGTVDKSSGVYQAPATITTEGPLTITARKKDEPAKSGSGVVVLSKDTKLQVLPSAVTVRASQVVPFTVISVPEQKAADVLWQVSPNVGHLTADGVYQAPEVISKSQTVTLLARLANNKKPIAGAHITLIASVEPCSRTRPWLLAFVLVMGAIGSLLHAIASFGAFVGNRQFSASWTWWYLLRPLLGAGLALIVFFVVGGGFLAGQNVGSLFGVAAISALAGLFSEQATLKLKELVETVLATKASDPRAGKLRADANRPTIASIKPTSVVHGGALTPVEIIGTNFASGCQVKVNDGLRAPKDPASTKLTLELTAAEITAPGKFKLAVVNPNGDVSNEVELTVT